eukprot:11063178-Karenia_brevis.AAC.1
MASAVSGSYSSAESGRLTRSVASSSISGGRLTTAETPGTEREPMLEGKDMDQLLTLVMLEPANLTRQ